MLHSFDSVCTIEDWAFDVYMWMPSQVKETLKSFLCTSSSCTTIVGQRESEESLTFLDTKFFNYSNSIHRCPTWWLNSASIVSFDGSFESKECRCLALTWVVFSRIPSAIRPRDYDRSAVMRLIHECMGLPASPPVTSEESEVENDSPTPCSAPAPQPPAPAPPAILPQPIQMPVVQTQPAFNPQLITIDERTMQLHFTPLYFGERDLSPWKSRVYVSLSD